MADARNVAK